MKWLIGLAIVGVILVGAWMYWFPTYSHRYKMTVEIEVDGKLHRGSGIVDVTFTTNGPLAPLANGTEYVAWTTGRAALIDLGVHGVVLACAGLGVTYYEPTPEAPQFMALRAFYTKAWRRDWRNSLRSISRESGVRILSPNNYPAFVWLSDRKARRSAVPVPPDKMGQFIDSSARLVNASIEITRERLTDDIFEKLPWLREAQKAEKMHGSSQNPRAYKLTAFQVLGVSK